MSTVTRLILSRVNGSGQVSGDSFNPEGDHQSLSGVETPDVEESGMFSRRRVHKFWVSPETSTSDSSFRTLQESVDISLFPVNGDPHVFLTGPLSPVLLKISLDKSLGVKVCMKKGSG